MAADSCPVPMRGQSRRRSGGQPLRQHVQLPEDAYTESDDNDDDEQLLVLSAAKPAGRSGGEMPRKTLQLEIEGMSCASCASSVQSALAKRPGVASVAVNLMLNRAAIDFDPSEVGLGCLQRQTAAVAGF